MVSYSKVSLSNLKLVSQFLLTEASCLLYIMLKTVLFSFKYLRFSLTTFIMALSLLLLAQQSTESQTQLSADSYLLKD